MHEQIERGTHFGASHEREIAWAEWILRLVPSAERVRFTSSGTEATLMALRLARAFTGKSKIIRFKHHFHGWHDHMTSGFASHFDGTATTGVLPGVAGNVLLAEQNDAAGLAELLGRHDDIAAAIIEPTGAHGARLPIRPEFLQALREQTRDRGVLLIFDEVVTGFRVAPGGAQAEYGIRPDLTTLAKIMAGGLPGGAVAGRKDILDLLDFEVARAAGREKIAHQGTYNANPLSAAAGIATLQIVATGDACVARQPLWRNLAAPSQRGLRRGKSPVGGLRHVFDVSHFHQSRAGCDRPDALRPASAAGGEPRREAPNGPCRQAAAGDDGERGRSQRQSGGHGLRDPRDARARRYDPGIAPEPAHAAAGGRDLKRIR